LLDVIGGIGLYALGGLRIKDEPPFWISSAAVVAGLMGDREIAFLPRHGRDHSLLPSEINYRTNVFALKPLGVARVLSVFAVRSLTRSLTSGANENGAGETNEISCSLCRKSLLSVIVADSSTILPTRKVFWKL